MKTSLFIFFTLLLFVPWRKAGANSLLGASLGYRLISVNGNEQIYRVTLTLYGDCSADRFPPSAFPKMKDADPMIWLMKGDAFVTYQRLSYNASESDMEITPVCPREAGSTSCNNPFDPIPGVKKYVYEGDFTLEGTSDNWQFSFAGSLRGGYQNTTISRSQIISNIVYINSMTAFPVFTYYLEATLNNTKTTNNSPTFSSFPIPFFCVNKPATYSMGASDSDNDELRFSLVPGRNISNRGIAYKPPYTPFSPLPTAPGNFRFDSTNSQINFTPDRRANCLVVERVDEYRNGEKVGSTTREMTFMMLDNCDNDAPLTSVTNIQNASVSTDSSGNVLLSVCEGQSAPISFDVDVTDANGDNTVISYSNLQAGASITINNNGTPNPKAHFVWNPTEATPGYHTFYLTATDNGCPIYATRNIAYTIMVIPHPIKFSSGGDAVCEGTDTGKLWVIPPPGISLDYSYRWVNASGNTLRNTNSTQGDTLSGIPAGRYKVYIRNGEGCGPNLNLNLDTLPLPVVTLRGDTTLCTGMPFTLEARLQDSIRYRWSTGDTNCCIKVTQPGLYVLTATNKCGSSEAGVRINYIKCNYCFFIPNAFSPNGDGRNDRFELKQTCPTNKYLLQIFDRWGRRLFTALSIGQSWDGTYNGQPVASGTYFYMLEARPEDPSQELIKLKGDLTLIR